MASKRHRGEGSSTAKHKAYDRVKFINEAAAEKFRSWQTRTVILERGLEPDPTADGELAVMIAERGWAKLTAPPDTAVVPVVKEFYANLRERHFHAVHVRERSVSIQSTAINEFFNLTEYTGAADHHASEEHDYEQIVQTLCKPGTQWTVRDRGALTFPQAALSMYGKAWHAFICARLMPTTHLTHVTKERAVLLYCIVTGKNINIGAVIENFIKRFIMGGTTTGGFPYPSLVTALCFQAGVRWADREPVSFPAPTINHAVISRYKCWGGAPQNQRGLGFMIDHGDHAADQPGARQLRRIQHQLEEQHQELLRENTRLAQRQDVISTNNNQFQEALVQMFAQLHPGAGPFHFPVPQPLPTFPPSESDDDSNEEGDGDGDGEDGDDA